MNPLAAVPELTAAAPRPAVPTPSLELTHPRPWLVVGTLLQREFVRFIRQRHRVFGALGQPLIFLVLFGAGLHGSFRNPLVATEHTYFEYFFPGTLILILLFTAIFATISIIEDRREGFLQSVLVAPAPRWTIALGKMLGTGSLAVSQVILFMIIAPLVGIPFDLLGWAGAVAVMAVIALALTGLGFMLAWSMDSAQGYHAIMNVALIPMWLLSGAFFPASGATGWMRAIMLGNPLTYGTAAVRHMLYLHNPAMTAGLPSLAVSLGVTALFAAAAFAGAVWITGVHFKKHQ